jgi:phosphoglycolate phosphatase-like HAD superfamily hydrolase
LWARADDGVAGWGGDGYVRRMAKTAALFDIDGSLVDSNFLHVDAWSRAFAEAGRPVDAWRIHRAIGMGSDQLIVRLLGEADADRLGERIEKGHSEHYRAAAPQLRAFDRGPDLVREVAKRGVEVVFATSAAPDELERLLDVLAVDDAVAEVTSAQDVEAAKPEPDLVHVALDCAGVSADAAVFIGDSRWDVEAAVRAGVDCIGLRSGGTSAAELSEAGAVAVYDDAADLLERLDGSPLARLWS